MRNSLALYLCALKNAKVVDHHGSLGSEGSRQEDITRTSAGDVLMVLVEKSASSSTASAE